MITSLVSVVSFTVPGNTFVTTSYASLRSCIGFLLDFVLFSFRYCFPNFF